MKKSKFVIGLTAAFLSSVALMSCSSLIKSRDDVVLTIDGVPYTAEDLFNDQKTPAAAEAKFNAVYKVAVRAYFKEGKPGYNDMREITNDTKIKISEQKSIAQSNADKNHTSYDEEWKKILDSNGVDNEKGLYDKFEYELQKEKFENKFYDEHYAELRNGEFPGLDPKAADYKFKNYLEGKQPYHIKHILVKIAGMKAGDGVNAEITRDEANKLAGVITELANGTDFATVSDHFNDDETAKKNGGSLGIMSRDTSFVNDFKLGIYLYESYFGGATDEGTRETPSGDYKAIEAKKYLGLNDDSDAATYAKHLGVNSGTHTSEDMIDPTTSTYSESGESTDGFGIGQIPYEVAQKLKDYAECDFTGEGDISQGIINRFKAAQLDKDDVAAKFYPRNVIFNKYFNKHNIMVITPRKTHEYSEELKTWVSGLTTGSTKRENRKDYYYGKAMSGTLPVGFTYPAKNDDNMRVNFPSEPEPENTTNDNDVLRDKEGRVILVFRSGNGGSKSNDDYEGIHFVVIERSPFVGLEYDEGSPSSTDAKTTSIDEYYTHYYPEQPGGNHPKYNDDTYKKTFVYYNSEKTIELKERADTVKSELKKCDDKLNTYLYQHLLVKGDIKFNPEVKKKYKIDIEKDINDWIKMTRVSKEFDTKKSWDDTWKEYYYSLMAQQEQRAEESDGKTIYSRLIPEICAVTFTDSKFDKNLGELFGVGGVFHE